MDIHKHLFRSIVSFATLFIFYGCAMPEGPVSLSGEAPIAEGWDTETVLTGLEQPWSITWLPNGDMLITERSGQIQRINTETLERQSIDGVPAVFVDGQGGLMDISLHPAFEENSFVYITYSSGNKDANRTTVGRGILDGHTLSDFEEIFRVVPDKDSNQHFGSRMVWTSDSTFAIAIGDGGNRPEKTQGVLSREHAQMINSHLGKVLHLNEDGTAVYENPFKNDTDAFPEIWSWGHRNIQGLALNPNTGQLWANEHGSRGGDELNLLSAGENYGWPVVTYSREYWYTRISRETSKPGMVDPKIVWTPAQAPSGLTFYNGDKFPDWQGDLFSGGLQGEQVRRVILDGETVMGEESIPIGRRVRDVRQGPEGFLYVLTGHDDGELIRIVPEN